MEETLPSFRPGVFYYRDAYRKARTQMERDEIFFSLCRRDEALRDWVRERGMIPPKFEAVDDEIEDKPWLSLVDDNQLNLDLSDDPPAS